MVYCHTYDCKHGEVVFYVLWCWLNRTTRFNRMGRHSSAAQPFGRNGLSKRGGGIVKFGHLEPAPHINHYHLKENIELILVYLLRAIENRGLPGHRHGIE